MKFRPTPASALRAVLKFMMLCMLLATAAFGGTVAYYRFDGSTLNDSTGNASQNGTMSSGSASYSSTVPGATVPQTGQSNTQSISLGASNYPLFNYAFPFDTLANATLEFWVNPSQLNGENDMFWTTLGSGDQNRYNIFLGSAGDFRMDYREPAGNLHTLADVANAVSIGQWTFLAITKSGSTYSVYVNNATTPSSTVTDSSPNLPTSSGWTLDGRSLAGNCSTCTFFGLMDEIRISDTVLDPSQFLIAQSGSVPEPSSMLLMLGGGLLLAWRRRR